MKPDSVRPTAREDFQNTTDSFQLVTQQWVSVHCVVVNLNSISEMILSQGWERVQRVLNLRRSEFDLK